MGTDPREPVERLISAIQHAPTELPLAQIAAVHRTGHDVRVEAGQDTIVALIRPRRDGRLAALTPRERQVATAIATGDTNRQIASALGISLATVKDHVHAILAKTGFDSRSRLIAAWYGGLELDGNA